jgi:hypothetical protein
MSDDDADAAADAYKLLDDIDSKIAQRAVIAFLARKKLGPTAIRQEMVSVYGES